MYVYQTQYIGQEKCVCTVCMSNIPTICDANWSSLQKWAILFCGSPAGRQRHHFLYRGLCADFSDDRRTYASFSQSGRERRVGDNQVLGWFCGVALSLKVGIPTQTRALQEGLLIVGSLLRLGGWVGRRRHWIRARSHVGVSILIGWHVHGHPHLGRVCGTGSLAHVGPIHATDGKEPRTATLALCLWAIAVPRLEIEAAETYLTYCAGWLLGGREWRGPGWSDAM